MSYRQAMQAVLTGSVVAVGAAASPVAANPGVTLDSAVFVERMQPGNIRNLEPASRLTRGDRVVTILTWKRSGETPRNGGGFTLVNPLPDAIAYQASARDDEEVSVDGGRSWGRIGELMSGAHVATPEDVTHVRWRVPARSAAAGAGRIAYSGIVR